MNDVQANAKEIFLAALDCPTAEELARFLDEACGGDAALRARVGELLQARSEAGSFLGGNWTSATEELSPLAESAGTVIGPYKLLQQIGEGGFGVVFMAEQTEPIQRTVALKIIKPGMDTRQVIARFEAERQALAMMDHPNIARVLDVGATGAGLPYFVMDLVKGVPITDYCDQQHFPVRERLELMATVCQAVQHAHQKGIIHRDLKPTNVLVAEYDGKPVPKIIDFGVAKATAQRLTEKTMFTELGQMVGTVEYMSPEQARFNQLDVDTRSDIYSLGVLLYELLTGSTPFARKRLQGAAFDEMLRIIREEEPPKPSTRLSTTEGLPSIAANRGLEPLKLNRLVQGELDWIVMKALEKDRNRRYETANGFAADVQRYLHDETVQACPPSAVYRFRKLVRRNKFVFAAVGAVSAAVLLGLTVSTWLFLQEKTARQQAVSAAAKATTINDLLQQMLASANPDRTKGADFTVRQLLDGFSEEVLSQLKNQPEVAAAIHATIGNAYRRLGLTNKAEPHLSAALELRKKTFGPNHVEVAQSLLDYAWNRFESSDPEGTTDHARQALAIFKQDDTQCAKVIETLSVMQLSLNGLAEFAEAETVANEALALGRQHFPNGNADLANVLHRLAGATIVRHQPENAERLARDSVTMHRKFHGDSHPETGWGLYHLGWALQEQQKYDDAEPYFREALAVFRKHYDDEHGGSPQTRQHLREVLTARGDQVGLARLEAEVAVRASELVARTDDALQRGIYRGNLHRESGELDKAIAEYTAVIAAKPEMAEAWGFRGDCYLRKGEFAKAAADYSEALKCKPLEGRYWHERGYAYLVLGEHEKSVADHSQAIELNDSDAGQRLRRGQSYQALGELQKAEVDYSKAIELNPYYWEDWFARAQLYAEQKQWEKAEADLTEAIKSCTANKPYERNAFAWALCTRLDPRLQKPEAALDQAEKAVASAPNDGNLWNTLGLAHYRSGNWQDAIDALTKSMELRGNGNSFDWFFLAMAHWQQGDRQQAGVWYDKAVKSMDENQPQNAELDRFRSEAEELLRNSDEKQATKPESK